MTSYVKPADRRMLDIEIELEAAEDVTFEDDCGSRSRTELAL
jgi:hypothetical protein